jgi:uncharacterized membrane protein
MKTVIKTAFFWLLLCLTSFAQEFNFASFDVPGAVLTRPFGVNARGQIVGLYRDINGNHGFLRKTDGTYTAIQVPGSTFTNATSINARGDIVGRWTDGAGNNHGYLRQADGQFILFDPATPCVVGKAQTVPHGINDIGDMVGRCYDSNGKELGWLWSHDGTFTILDDPGHLTTDAWMPTNRDLTVGDYSDATEFVHGYARTSDSGFVTLDFPGNQTSLRAMNERGDITGIYSPATGPFHGFLMTDGRFTIIDYPGGTSSGGTLVINDSGLIVGGYIDTAGKEHGFIATHVR